MKSPLKRLFYLVLAAAGVAATVYALRPPPVEVDLANVQRGRLLVTVEEDGKTRIREKYTVSAPLAGRLLRVEMEPGDPVSQGASRLAMIAPRAPELLDARELAETEARVKAVQAALEQAQPELERARAALDYAEGDLARLRKLVQQRAASTDELAKAEMRYRMRKEDYRAERFDELIARYELKLAQAALVRTQPVDNNDHNVADLEIYSPIDGRVLRVFQESATVVNPGTRLLELGDPRDLEVEIDVLSSDAVKVEPGTAAFLEQWGGEAPLNGRVRLVEPSAFTKISALGVEEQRVNVIIDFVDPPEVRAALGDGFRVEAQIVIWEGEDVLKVPSGALFRVGDNWAVFLVRDRVATLQPIQVGHYNALEAEVLNGLQLDDQVILHPSDKIASGRRVRPRDESQQSVR